MRIILLTVLNVLTRQGISHPGRATMEEFKGMDRGRDVV